MNNNGGFKAPFFIYVLFNAHSFDNRRAMKALVKLDEQARQAPNEAFFPATMDIYIYTHTQCTHANNGMNGEPTANGGVDYSRQVQWLPDMPWLLLLLLLLLLQLVTPQLPIEYSHTRLPSAAEDNRGTVSD